MRYIDADRLIAEIERRMTENCELSKKAKCFSHRAVEDNDILAFIDSLQQEQTEVDLEKALDEYYKNADFGPAEAIEYEIHKDIARHFYELGLNARKEETK